MLLLITIEILTIQQQKRKKQNPKRKVTARCGPKQEEKGESKTVKKFKKNIEIKFNTSPGMAQMGLWSLWNCGALRVSGAGHSSLIQLFGVSK